MDALKKLAGKKLTEAAQKIGKKIMDVMPSAIPTDNVVTGIPGQAYQDIATMQAPKQMVQNVAGRQLGMKGDVSDQALTEEAAVMAGIPREAAAIGASAVPFVSMVANKRMVQGPKKVPTADTRTKDVLELETQGLFNRIAQKHPDNLKLLGRAAKGDSIAKMILEKDYGRNAQKLFENRDALLKMRKK